MGRKRFNAKARENPDRIIDNSQIKDIKIDIKGNQHEYGGYDEANPLVLPSEKRKTKIIKEKNAPVTRILTKKQRKNLEKIVDKKKKKEGRAELLEALAAVQVSAEELKKYTSISKAQTLGVKNSQRLEKDLEIIKEIQTNDKDNQITRISSIAGKSKRKRLALLAGYTEVESSDENESERKRKTKNLNIIGIEPEDDSSDSEAESEKSTENEEHVKIDGKLITKSENEHWTSENIDNINTVPKVTDLNCPEVKPQQINLENKEIKTEIKQPLKPTVYIHVERDPYIQAARLKLPILAEEQQIMEIITENSIIIIAGETGSGKTTQIPQFLYEAGYAEKKLIGITEPRRVAAISMSKRVATEMNLSEKIVSYLIRFEGNVTDSTKIKFMTDGVLLKEIESDFLLRKYSVIILDEAHERSSYTDILIGLLSRIVPLRNKKGNPLKLIIMSATLRVEDFTLNTKLFKLPPPVITVEARQFPVTIHFQKNTPDDYVKESYRKILKIHSKLPEGGILVFLTGQQEVNILVRKLRKAFPVKDLKNLKYKENVIKKPHILNDEEFDIKRAIKNVTKSKKKLAEQITNLPKINLDNYKLPSDDTEADLLDIDENVGDDDDALDSDEDFEGSENLELSKTKQPLWVLPLYSLLSTENQAKVFNPIPEGCRLCVVSTNIAETSLTIPNIKYVVDSGRQKTRLYDKITGVSAFLVTYTSKASANQRAGRAGRVSPGHCYRLYSSAVFLNEFEDFSTPDIQKKPVDDLMLQMKCMGIDKVINFPFPSSPDLAQLETAEERLILLGALEDVEAKMKGNIFKEKVAKVTPLGQAISAFPVAPRYGKMLALSHQKKLLPYTVCMVAALSVQEVLIEITFDQEGSGNVNSKWYNKRRNWAGTGNSLLLGDPMVLLKAVGASEYAGSQGKLEEFCEQNGLRSKAISEIRKLRVQLTNEINLNLPNVKLFVDPKMEPPTDFEAKYLRQILLTGMGDHVARKLPLEEITDKDKRRKLKMAYNCANMEEPVFMHSASVLNQKLPEWVIYQEVYELQNGDSTKMFMRGCTAVEPEWLLTYVPKMCNILSVKEDPLPKYNVLDGKIYCYVEATFGKAAWPIPLTEIEMPMDEKSCRYFGMFLLNGDVFPRLLEFKNKLKTTPSSITKSWSNLNEFVANFTKAILSKQINSKQKLLDIWKLNPKYLLQQYVDLLYDVQMTQLSLIWPPIEENEIMKK